MPNGVEFEGRLAHVGTFPIGIDPTSFTEVCTLSSFLFRDLRVRVYDAEISCVLCVTELEEGIGTEENQTARAAV